MRKAISFGTMLALLCVPASALGASLSLSGPTTININEGGGSGTISVNIVVSGASGLEGYDVQLLASESGVFDISSRSYPTLLSEANTTVLTSTGLDPYNVDNLGSVGASTGDSVSGDNITLATIGLDYTLPGDAAVDDVITINAGIYIDLGGGMYLPLAPTAQPGTVDMSPVTGLSITLTPEPTSALLLLATVPFLRRRRA